MIDLSVIIVSFNTKKLTLRCIESIIDYTLGISYEVIVVDNASTDGSVDAISKIKNTLAGRVGRKSNMSIKIIRNKENVGFGHANNQGIREARGEFVLLLNSDTYFSSNLMPEMINWMRRHRDVAVSSCALLNPDGSIQETGGYFPNLFRVFSWMFFIDDVPFLDRVIKPFHPMHSASPLYKNIAHFSKAKEVDWLTGAFLLIRKDVLDKVGLFDEDYFMYTEEVDLCYRIKKAGFKVWYLPILSITHLGGASGGKEFSILKEYEGIKIFYRKHMPAWQFPFLRLFLKSGAALRMFIFGILRGFPSAKTYAKALKSA